MTPLLKHTAVLLLMLIILPGTPASGAEPSADAQFEAIYKTEWDWRNKQFIVSDDGASDAISPNLPDVSKAAQDQRLHYWNDVLARLNNIAAASLSKEQQINYLVYKSQIENLISAQQFRLYEKPNDPGSGDTAFWVDLTESARQTFKTEQDYLNYLSQLHEFPRFFRQSMTNMQAGLQRGFTAPKISLQGRDAGAASVIETGTLEDNIYYTPFKAMPDVIPMARQRELQQQARTVISADVIPAYQTLVQFLREDYIPHAQPSIAATDLPDGDAFYRAQIRLYTTLELTPDQIHSTGLDEVSKIRSEMLAVMQQVKFAGDLPAFLHFLRTDPQFYAGTPQALLEHAAWICKMFDGKAKNYFGLLPRSRFAIIPVPDDIAPFYTSARGGPGAFYLNTYNLPSRPLFSLPALALHESAPGHAFQMPLASENKSLPPFRQNSYISAYGEGWALYSERLGVEMGMYQTPYEIFGMLSLQMWRAARLVVDTGIHSKHWSRAQAQQFLHDNTALSDHEISTEVDRYIAWPGQALSYYLGEMAIWKARHKAEAALGEKFDVRAFHDAVLELGSVPLTVLEARIDRFIAENSQTGK